LASRGAAEEGISNCPPAAMRRAPRGEWPLVRAFGGRRDGAGRVAQPARAPATAGQGGHGARPGHASRARRDALGHGQVLGGGAAQGGGPRIGQPVLPGGRGRRDGRRRERWSARLMLVHICLARRCFGGPQPVVSNTCLILRPSRAPRPPPSRRRPRGGGGGRLRRAGRPGGGLAGRGGLVAAAGRAWAAAGPRRGLPGAGLGSFGGLGSGRPGSSRPRRSRWR
jgi:hypothetical protein